MNKNIAAALMLFLAGPASWASNLVLWYQQPMRAGHFMDEALPLGNGRIGALISGGVGRENLVLNEDSLWSGDANTSGNYDTMGTYQMLGNLIINLPGQENYSAYYRDLDIGEALAQVSYEVNGVKFK